MTGHGRGVGVNGSNSTYYNPELNKSYGDAMSEHMLVVTDKGAGNPFRPNVKHSMKTSFNKLKPLNPRDPLEYKNEVSYKRAGSLNIVIKHDSTIKSGDIPTRSEIHSSTAKIARKALLSYDTRAVETGALLRALQSHKHETPGTPAVMDLHMAFIHAASMNPDPWLLRREQMCAVIRDKVRTLININLNGLENSVESIGWMGGRASCCHGCVRF